jgi:hypothetical protein
MASGSLKKASKPNPFIGVPAFATKIVDKLTVDLDLGVFHDGYKERIEALIQSKTKGEVAQGEERKAYLCWFFRSFPPI